MATLKLKFRDISRMTKKYPYTRHLPRTQLVSDKEFELEVMSVQVDGAEEKVITWSKQFTGMPNVTATIAFAEGDSTGLGFEMANVNVYIKEVTVTTCTVAFSDTFTGTINVQAIRFS